MNSPLWTINDNDASGWSTLNLKANPLAARQDKADQFSSWTYGDPVTPLPRLYANDPLVIRTISVSPTIDTLHLQGGRTVLEPRYAHAGASEPGDYLYANGNEQRTQQGAWGIVRILPGRVDDLRPLPGVDTPSDPYVQPTPTGGAPPVVTSAGSPCPTSAPTRRFDVSAIDRSGTFSGARTAYVPRPTRRQSRRA